MAMGSRKETMVGCRIHVKSYTARSRRLAFHIEVCLLSVYKDIVGASHLYGRVRRSSVTQPSIRAAADQRRSAGRGEGATKTAGVALSQRDDAFFAYRQKAHVPRIPYVGSG